MIEKAEQSIEGSVCNPGKIISHKSIVSAMESSAKAWFVVDTLSFDETFIMMPDQMYFAVSIDNHDFRVRGVQISEAELEERFLNLSGSQPLVAVCTPVYNGDAYLEEMMRAVQAQSYGNLVHCISENASTDRTADIIHSFRNGRVPIVVSRTDATIPMIANWNRVVHLAPPQARWIRVLCADDTIEPTAIERMVSLAQTDPHIGLVGSARFRNGQIDDFFWPEGQSVFDGEEACRRYFEYRGTVMGTHVMVRRDLLFETTDPFDASLLGCDTETCLRVLLKSKFAYVHAPLCTTREHPGAVSSTEMSVWRRHFFDWLILLDRYGPRIYPLEQYKALRRIYLLYYLRKLLVWRFTDKNGKELWQRHLDMLRAYGLAVNTSNFVEAFENWFLKRLNIQAGWIGYPF